MSTRRAALLHPAIPFRGLVAVALALASPSCGGPDAEDTSEPLLVSITEGPEALGAEIVVDRVAYQLIAEVGERGFEVRVFEPGGALSTTFFRDAQGALVSFEEPLTPAVPRPTGTMHPGGDPGLDVVDELVVAHKPLGIGSTCFVARCETAPSPVACCAEELRKNLRREDGATIVWRFSGHGLGEPSSEDVAEGPRPR